MASGYNQTDPIPCPDPVRRQQSAPYLQRNQRVRASASPSDHGPNHGGASAFGASRYADLLCGIVSGFLGSCLRRLPQTLPAWHALLGLIVVLGFSTLWLASGGGSSSGSTSNPGTPKGHIHGQRTGTSGTSTLPLEFRLSCNNIARQPKPQALRQSRSAFSFLPDSCWTDTSVPVLQTQACTTVEERPFRAA